MRDMQVGIGARTPFDQHKQPQRRAAAECCSPRPFHDPYPYTHADVMMSDSTA
jgi:hypothetical protein